MLRWMMRGRCERAGGRAKKLREEDRSVVSRVSKTLSCSYLNRRGDMA